MGQAHIVIDPSLRAAVESVATILSSAQIDVGMLHRIETPLLPDGYHGVMDIVVDGDSVTFKKDQDV